jgi:hypothetical protein
MASTGLLHSTLEVGNKVEGRAKDFWVLGRSTRRMRSESRVHVCGEHAQGQDPGDVVACDRGIPVRERGWGSHHTCCRFQNYQRHKVKESDDTAMAGRVGVCYRARREERQGKERIMANGNTTEVAKGTRSGSDANLKSHREVKQEED